MKLFEEFKLFEDLWDDPGEDIVADSEEDLSACLSRISDSARRRPSFDPYEAPLVGEVWVALSRSDLEKALEIGDSGLSATIGRSAPAKLINRVVLLFWYDDEDDMPPHIILELAGNENELAKYFDAEIRVGDLNIAQHFQSYEEAEKYFNTEIVPNAGKLASQIINNSWEEYGFGEDL